MLENVESWFTRSWRSCTAHRWASSKARPYAIEGHRHTSHLPVRHVFMFIGAEPNTAWLNGCVALDEKGYILTGPRVRTT